MIIRVICHRNSFGFSKAVFFCEKQKADGEDSIAKLVSEVLQKMRILHYVMRNMFKAFRKYLRNAVFFEFFSSSHKKVLALFYFL